MHPKTEASRKYHRTPRGYLTFTFRNMHNRVTGKTNRPKYIGLPLLDRDEFIEWAMSDQAYQELFAAWLEAGCPRRLAPSVNRKDATKGYTLDNIEFIPLWLNSAMANQQRTAA